MSAEQAALIPHCVECGEVWLPADKERWQALWIDDGGRDEVLVFYCRDCARREFGGEEPVSAAAALPHHTCGEDGEQTDQQPEDEQAHLRRRA
jgi:hypothetical protein